MFLLLLGNDGLCQTTPFGDKSNDTGHVVSAADEKGTGNKTMAP